MMLKFRDQSAGIVRNYYFGVAAAGGPKKAHTRAAGRAGADPDEDSKDARRDPAFHNRVLFAGADR